jgi:riboflavin biosynthesis pyrimidine reductase
VRMLLPHPAEPIDLAAVYADAQRRPNDGRPWVLINMIASVDGAASLDGRSGTLGGPADREVFSVLRSCAEVVLVGAETVRAERYGPSRIPGQRIAVVTRRGELDWASALFSSGAAVVVLPEDGPDVPVPSIRAGIGSVDLPAALRQLSADVVLAEGGPTLNGQLFDAGLVDELCVTVAPTVVGGQASRIVRGPGAAQRMTLAHVLEDDGFLFCRYVVRNGHERSS